MNNLMKFVDQANSQEEIIKLLKKYSVFDFVRRYVMLSHDIDFDGTEFINEEYPVQLYQVKGFVNEAIYLSIHSF